MALPYTAIDEALPPLADLLAGRVVIDVTVPIKTFPDELSIGTTTSAGAVSNVQIWPEVDALR